MKRISFLLLFFPCIVFAQQQQYTPYEFPNQIPAKYLFDAKADYDELSKLTIPKVKKRDIARFAEAVTYGKQSMFTSGGVYFNWDEFEDYLNKVVKLMLPDSLKRNTDIKVYLNRNPDYNAYAIHDGSLFMNIGMFADISNEAALAVLLGHELAHYIHKDSQNRFINGLKLYTKRNRNKNFALAIDKAHENREQEQAADSLGFILAEKAGYNITSGIANFTQFMDEEKIAESKQKTKTENGKSRLVNVGGDTSKTAMKKSLDNLLATHPEFADRIDFLNKYMNSEERTKGKKDFLVSNDNFNSLQQKAKLETLDLLLKANRFKTCAERAFVYYLLNPENDNYTYYLVESIRRAIYTNPKLAKKGFLMDQFEDEYDSKKHTGILHNLNLIIRDEKKYASIKAKELLDTSAYAFETYEQAFNYFAAIANKRNITEAILSQALYHNDSSQLKDELLKKYIDQKGKHQEYATALLKDKLYKELSSNKKQLLLFDKITLLEDHFYGYHDRKILAEERSDAFNTELKGMLKRKFPEKEFLSVRELETNDIRTAISFYNAIVATTYIKKYDSNPQGNNAEGDEASETYNFNDDSDTKSTTKKSANGKNKKEFDVFVFNPEYWQLFKKNKLQSIEYMKTTAFDDKTQLLKIINLINPCFYYTIFNRAAAMVFRGSGRYAHKIDYYAFDLPSKNPNFYSEIVKYKMTKAHFLNGIYYALKSGDNKQKK